MVTWWSGAGGIQALSERPTGFLQCFDTVGLVIWPVKIVPEKCVLSGTLSLYTTTTIIVLVFQHEVPSHCALCCLFCHMLVKRLHHCLTTLWMWSPLRVRSYDT